MHLVQGIITLTELKKMSEKMYGKLVKAVVDIEKNIMVVDADLHADQEMFLLEQDSQQENLWGINIYPERFGHSDWIEFDSMINLRPYLGNNSRSIDSQEIQKKIVTIVTAKVVE